MDLLKLFKSTNIMYASLCICGILIISFFATPKIGVIFSFLLIFLWIYITATIFNLVAAKKMGKVVRIMTDDCNIQEYIKIHNEFLRKNVRGTRTYLLLNLSSGYLNLGDHELAKNVLYSITEFSDNRAGALSKTFYLNNLFVYYLRINDSSNASICLEEMRLLLENKKLKSIDRERLLSIYNDKCVILNIENGNYDGAEQFFSSAFDKEKSCLGKVSIKYNLGKVYIHYGRLNEAKDAFEYAVKHGGDSYYVIESRRLLNHFNII